MSVLTWRSALTRSISPVFYMLVVGFGLLAGLTANADPSFKKIAFDQKFALTRQLEPVLNDPLLEN